MFFFFSLSLSPSLFSLMSSEVSDEIRNREIESVQYCEFWRDQTPVHYLRKDIDGFKEATKYVPVEDIPQFILNEAELGKTEKTRETFKKQFAQRRIKNLLQRFETKRDLERAAKERNDERLRNVKKTDGKKKRKSRGGTKFLKDALECL